MLGVGDVGVFLRIVKIDCLVSKTDIAFQFHRRVRFHVNYEGCFQDDERQAGLAVDELLWLEFDSILIDWIAREKGCAGGLNFVRISAFTLTTAISAGDGACEGGAECAREASEMAKAAASIWCFIFMVLLVLEMRCEKGYGEKCGDS